MNIKFEINTPIFPENYHQYIKDINLRNEKLDELKKRIKEKAYSGSKTQIAECLAQLDLKDLGLFFITFEKGNKAHDHLKVESSDISKALKKYKNITPKELYRLIKLEVFSLLIPHENSNFLLNFDKEFTKYLNENFNQSFRNNCNVDSLIANKESLQDELMNNEFSYNSQRFFSERMLSKESPKGKESPESDTSYISFEEEIDTEEEQVTSVINKN